MGEIRFVGTGETRGYPYLVCKKRFVGTGETHGYPYLVCKKFLLKLNTRISLSGMQEILAKARGYIPSNRRTNNGITSTSNMYTTRNEMHKKT